MGTPSSVTVQCQHVFHISSFLPDLCWDCLVTGHHGHRGGEEEGQGGEESPTDPSGTTTTRREKKEKESLKPDCSPRYQSWKRTSSWWRTRYWCCLIFCINWINVKSVMLVILILRLDIQ